MNATTQPLWPIYTDLVRSAPSPSSAAALWRGADVEAKLLAASVAVGAGAERRVMLLQNPALGRPAATHTLVAGLQLLLPGEQAPVHRHSQSGIRLMLSGGARMQVGAEIFDVQAGDLIVLPAMTAHGHACLGAEHALWLDVLDVPTVAFLGATFSDEAGALPAAPARPGARLTLEDARGALSPDPHPSLGRTARYRAGGAGDVLPVIRATLHELPAGARGTPWRSTASTVWVALSGEGALTLDGEPLNWTAGDVFVTPNWTWSSLSSGPGATLVSLSDAALLSALGLYIEEVA